MIKTIRNWLSLPARIRGLERNVTALNFNVFDLRRELELADARIKRQGDTIDHLTTVGIDVSGYRRQLHTIVLVGQFKGRDYVEVVNVSTADFAEFVGLAKDLKRRSDRFYMDEAPGMHLKAVVERL